MNYIVDFPGHGKFSPDGRVADSVAVDAHNAAVEAAELITWSLKPKRHVAYAVDAMSYRAAVTTFLGTPLGRVVASRSWIRHNRYGEPFRMTAIRVAGFNGARYHGVYGSDWSQAVRLRLVKG